MSRYIRDDIVKEKIKSRFSLSDQEVASIVDDIQDSWVPAGKRRPTKSGYYLCTVRGLNTGRIFVTEVWFYAKKDRFERTMFETLAWMDMPDEWRGETTEIWNRRTE